MDQVEEDFENLGVGRDVDGVTVVISGSELGTVVGAAVERYSEGDIGMVR